MHQLALALHHKGYTITGSDDEIFEPAKSNLAAAGLLPAIFTAASMPLFWACMPVPTTPNC